jgi:diadenosine tetraphosphatase ApaH/serine/threonine PP2A family protein phosphatase
MKIALFGDVHSNLPALEAVAKEIERISPDAVYFLGDAVGYGPWPKETLDLLKKIVTEGVLGNHDAGVVGKTDISDYYDAVRYVINWTTDIISNDQYEFLDKLKYIHVDNEKDFLLSHGSPRMPERYDYIFGEKSVSRLYEVKQFLKMINFVGHSHYMNLFLMTGQNKSVEIDISSGEIELDFKKPAICVCGSVGQPRDGDSRAGFVTYDTDKKILKFHRVEYDYEKTVRKIMDLRLPRSFGERLRDGY